MVNTYKIYKQAPHPLKLVSPKYSWHASLSQPFHMCGVYIHRTFHGMSYNMYLVPSLISSFLIKHTFPSNVDFVRRTCVSSHPTFISLCDRKNIQYNRLLTFHLCSVFSNKHKKIPRSSLITESNRHPSRLLQKLT